MIKPFYVDRVTSTIKVGEPAITTWTIAKAGEGAKASVYDLAFAYTLVDLLNYAALKLSAERSAAAQAGSPASTEP